MYLRYTDNAKLIVQLREQLGTNCLDVENCVPALVKLLPSHNAQVGALKMTFRTFSKQE
jgi:hypothetical protein